MARESPCEFIKAFDMYGPQPTFTFKRRKEFRTWVGAIFTIFALFLFFSFSLSRTMSLIKGDDPFLSMITLLDDYTNEVNLVKLNYRFGISKIDETKGLIKVNYVTWLKG